MSRSVRLETDEVRDAGRRMRAAGDDLEPVVGRVAEAAGSAAGSLAGFETGRSLAALAGQIEERLGAIGERLGDQSDRVVRAADTHEEADDESAAEFEAIEAAEGDR